jgi:hypothetical protein
MALPIPAKAAPIHIAATLQYNYDFTAGGGHGTTLCCDTNIASSSPASAELVKLPVLPPACVEEAHSLAATMVADRLVEVADTEEWGQIERIISDSAVAYDLEVGMIIV